MTPEKDHPQDIERYQHNDAERAEDRDPSDKQKQDCFHVAPLVVDVSIVTKSGLRSLRRIAAPPRPLRLPLVEPRLVPGGLLRLELGFHPFGFRRRWRRVDG
jgi:hypothetical protein